MASGFWNNIGAALSFPFRDADGLLPVSGMMPTWVAASAFNGGSTGTFTVDLPTGWAQNDILLLFVETANEAIAAPANWTEVTNSPQGIGTAAGAAATRITVFWKRAGSSESAVTVGDSGEHTIGVMGAVRGCPTSGDPFDVTAGATSASSASVSMPSVTTTVANCLIVGAVARWADTAGTSFTTWANAALSDVTERIDGGSVVGNGGGIGVYTGGKATAGATGNTTATISTGAQEHGMLTMALKPA